MRSLRPFRKIKNVYKRVLYVISVMVLAVSASLPAYAAPTFTTHPISSGIASATEMTTAGGLLWYLGAGSTHIVSMTTSGMIASYDIPALSGYANLVLQSITAGPDGNVWFSAKSGSFIYTGFLNISTGTVTLYSTGYLNGTLKGKIITGSDGRLWFTYKTATSPAYTYLVSVDPTSGTATTGYTRSDTYENYTDMAMGPDGKLWVTDAYYNKVYKFTLTSGSAVLSGNYSIPTSSSSPGGVIGGPDGNVWFMEMSTGKIVKLTPSGTFTEYTPAAGTTLGTSLVAGPDGAVWLTATVSGVKSIARITSAGATTTYTIPGSSIGLSNSHATLGPDGNVWFGYQDSTGDNLGSITTAPSFTNHSIISSSTGGMIVAGGSLWYIRGGATYIGNITTSGTTTDYNIRSLSGDTNLTLKSITTGPDGRVWFSAQSGSFVYAGSLNISTGSVTLYSGAYLQGSLKGDITTGPDGRVWFAYKTATSPAYSYIVNVDPSTGATTVGYTMLDTNANFTDLTTGPDGKLWVTDAYYNRVRKFTINSASSVVSSGSYTIPSASSSPGDLTAGPDGNMWFNEYSTGKIGKVTLTGVFTEFTLPAGVSFRGPLTSGPDGAIWFPATNGSAKSVARMTTAGVAVTYAVPGSGLVGTSFKNIASGPDGAIWFDYEDSGGVKMGRLGY